MKVSKYIKSYGRHYVDNKDFLKIKEILNNDFITQGLAVKKFENEISKTVNSKECIVCSNGTSALHLSLLSINIKEGDYVIIPAITFLAAANSVKYLNAKVVFTDVNHESGLVEPKNLLETISKCKKLKILKKVKAFIPVHLNGQCVDLKIISNICKKNNIKVIEDSCHALGTKYIPKKSKKIYKIGDCKFSDVATFSFHPVKSITTGEGGALTFNKKEKKKKLEILRNHGMIKSKKFFNYEVNVLGFNYRLSDLNCGLGISQLKKLNSFIKKRKKLFKYYDKKLFNLHNYLNPIKKYKHSETAWHLYVVNINFNLLKINKEELVKKLFTKGIGTQVHYVPLVFQPLYKNELRTSDYKGAKQYYKNCLTLPLSVMMTLKDIDYIAMQLTKIIDKNKKIFLNK